MAGLCHQLGRQAGDGAGPHLRGRQGPDHRGQPCGFAAWRYDGRDRAGHGQGQPAEQDLRPLPRRAPDGRRRLPAPRVRLLSRAPVDGRHDRHGRCLCGRDVQGQGAGRRLLRLPGHQVRGGRPPAARPSHGNRSLHPQPRRYRVEHPARHRHAGWGRLGGRLSQLRVKPSHRCCQPLRPASAPHGRDAAPALSGGA